MVTLAEMFSVGGILKVAHTADADAKAAARRVLKKFDNIKAQLDAGTVRIGLPDNVQASMRESTVEGASIGSDAFNAIVEQEAASALGIDSSGRKKSGRQVTATQASRAYKHAFNRHTKAKQGAGPTLAEVGAWNEFGVPGRIPERPFCARVFDKQSVWSRTLMSKN